MQFSVSDNWVTLQNSSYDLTPKMREAARKNVLIASTQALRMIKIRMPIDTGAARSSWGAKGANGIWIVSNNGMSITQGSKLPYIEPLNNGSSTQAPAGFIDVEEEKAVTLFVNNMAVDMGNILGF
jgi:hypothetical protein